VSPKLKVLSGKEILSIFQKLGFQKVAQRGSNVKLRRISPTGEKQTLTIVLHDELDKGTIKAIYRQAMKFFPEEILYKEFYTE